MLQSSAPPKSTGPGYVRDRSVPVLPFGQVNISSLQAGESAAMVAPAMCRSLLAGEQQPGFELPNKNDDYAHGPAHTGRAEEGHPPSTPGRPAIPPGYSNAFSVASIKQSAAQLKHACE